jgi:hypothetical protein
MQRRTNGILLSNVVTGPENRSLKLVSPLSKTRGKRRTGKKDTMDQLKRTLISNARNCFWVGDGYLHERRKFVTPITPQAPFLYQFYVGDTAYQILGRDEFE